MPGAADYYSERPLTLRISEITKMMLREKKKEKEEDIATRCSWLASSELGPKKTTPLKSKDWV